MNSRTSEEERIRKMKAEIHPFIQGVLDGKAALKELDYRIFELK